MVNLRPIHLGNHNLTCEKICFPSRKVARRAARTFHGEHKAPYRCGNHWHVGGLRPEILAGEKTRDEMYTRRRKSAL